MPGETYAVDGPGRELSPDEQDALNAVEDRALPPEDMPEVFYSPQTTRGWVPFRIANVECWRAQDGREWTRALEAEVVEAVVMFTKTRGMAPLHLVSVDGSVVITREQKKERRVQRELNKRGYA